MPFIPISNKSITLKSAESLMETPDTPIIVAGGPSSSNLLNNLKQNLVHDVLLLDQNNRDLQTQISMATSIFQDQLTALQNQISAIATRLPTVSGHLLADFWVPDFVDGSNTSEVNRTYGQATLPIVSTQEKLIGTDTQGNVWIPKGAQLSYSYVSSPPNEPDWLPDDSGMFALDQRTDTAWWRSRDTSGTVWVRARVPSNLNSSRFSNCIILHPYPVLYSDLVSVEYRNPAGVWTSVDISYLLGWSDSLARVQGYGNVRIWLPQTQVTEVRIKLSTTKLWGFSKISLQQVEFAPTATCVVDYSPYSPILTLSSPVVHGKDPQSLSFLSTSVLGSKVSVFMTQTAANVSPIISSIEVNNS